MEIPDQVFVHRMFVWRLVGKQKNHAGNFRVLRDSRLMRQTQLNHVSYWFHHKFLTFKLMSTWEAFLQSAYIKRIWLRNSKIIEDHSLTKLQTAAIQHYPKCFPWKLFLEPVQLSSSLSRFSNPLWRGIRRKKLTLIDLYSLIFCFVCSKVMRIIFGINIANSRILKPLLFVRVFLKGQKLKLWKWKCSLFSVD